MLLLQWGQILLVVYLLPNFTEQNVLPGSDGVWWRSGKQQPCPRYGQTVFNTRSISCTLSSRGSSSFPLGLLLSLPSAVRSSSTSSSLPSPAARHLSSFNLQMFSGPEPQKLIPQPFLQELPIFLLIIQLFVAKGRSGNNVAHNGPVFLSSSSLFSSIF